MLPHDKDFMEIEVQTQPADSTKNSSNITHTKSLRLHKATLWSKRTLLECVGLLLTGAILLYSSLSWSDLNLYGNAMKQADTAKYQCYALAFWQGANTTNIVPKIHCAFIPAIASSPPLHLLPSEYPFLTLIPFSIPLLAPLTLYPLAFALLMLLVAGGVYFLLRRFATPGAAWAFALYLIVGCQVTAPARYDLVPAALTLIALLCAERSKWKWSFALLALATLLKFYPLVLLPPFFIAQQMQEGEKKWYAWQRYIPVSLFAGVCLVVMGISLLLSVDGTLGPLDYFAYRPIQVESLAASVVRVIGLLEGERLRYTFSYGSRNVSSSLSPIVSMVDTVLLVVGLLSLYWLQWRKKIALSMMVLLTLLLLVLLEKVFSAQYLIWIAPFVAYVAGWNWKWLVGWSSVSLVTSLIYPVLYNRGAFWFEPYLPEFHGTVVVRNLLLLGFSCVLFYQVMRKQRRKEAQ